MHGRLIAASDLATPLSLGRWATAELEGHQSKDEERRGREGMWRATWLRGLEFNLASPAPQFQLIHKRFTARTLPLCVTKDISVGLRIQRSMEHNGVMKDWGCREECGKGTERKDNRWDIDSALIAAARLNVKILSLSPSSFYYHCGGTKGRPGAHWFLRETSLSNAFHVKVSLSDFIVHDDRPDSINRNVVKQHRRPVLTLLGSKVQFPLGPLH